MTNKYTPKIHTKGVMNDLYYRGITIDHDINISNKDIDSEIIDAQIIEYSKKEHIKNNIAEINYKFKSLYNILNLLFIKEPDDNIKRNLKNKNINIKINENENNIEIIFIDTNTNKKIENITLYLACNYNGYIFSTLSGISADLRSTITDYNNVDIIMKISRIIRELQPYKDQINDIMRAK